MGTVIKIGTKRKN